MLNGRIDIKVTGVKRYRLPIAVTVTGPFNQPAAARRRPTCRSDSSCAAPRSAASWS